MNPSDTAEHVRVLLDSSQQLRNNVDQTVEEFRKTYSQLRQTLEKVKSNTVSVCSPTMNHWTLCNSIFRFPVVLTLPCRHWSLP